MKSDKVRIIAVAILLIAVLAGGVVLRSTNLDFGLPYIYFFDEMRKLDQMQSVLDGNLNIEVFYHPSYLIYSSAAAAKLFEATGKHPLFLARGLVVAECILAALFLYVCGLKLGGRLAGLFAAAVVALCPLTVVASQHVKEDIPLFMWLCLQLIFCLAFLDSGKRWQLYLAALFGGFAASSKYFGAASFVLLYMLVRWQLTDEDRRGVMGRVLFIFAAGFLFLSPFVLVNLSDFFTDSYREFRHSLKGHRGLRVYPWEYMWTYHLTHSLKPALSWFLLAICLGGVVLCLFGDRKSRLVAAGFLLFYFLAETSPLKTPPDPARYVIASLPYLALCGGVALARTVQSHRGVGLVVGMIAILGFSTSAHDSYGYVCNRGPDDARTRAREWAVRNIAPDSLVFADFHNSFEPRDVFEKQYPDAFRIQVANEEQLGDPQMTGSDRDVYYIACSLAYQRHLDFPDHDRAKYEFYTNLFSTMTEVASFPPTGKPYGFVDPEVRIFRMVANEELLMAQLPVGSEWRYR